MVSTLFYYWRLDSLEGISFEDAFGRILNLRERDESLHYYITVSQKQLPPPAIWSVGLMKVVVVKVMKVWERLFVLYIELSHSDILNIAGLDK
jgi:hypothetical protein